MYIFNARLFLSFKYFETRWLIEDFPSALFSGARHDKRSDWEIPLSLKRCWPTQYTACTLVVCLSRGVLLLQLSFKTTNGYNFIMHRAQLSLVRCSALKMKIILSSHAAPARGEKRMEQEKLSIIFLVFSLCGAMAFWAHTFLVPWCWLVPKKSSRIPLAWSIRITVLLGTQMH